MAQTGVVILALMIVCGFCINICRAQDGQPTTLGENTAGGTQQCSDTRFNLLKDRVDVLTSNLDEVIAETNKLKSLFISTLGTVLNSELVNTDGGDVASCNGLGTASNPAFSCEQLMEACQLPSGTYYLRGGQATFHKVHCDMETFGGGWTRFGKGDMSSTWHYVDEDERTETFEMISESEILQMKNLQFTEFRVWTDVDFRLQGDDSVNPSRLSVVLLPHLSTLEMYIDGFADHTHLLFDETDEHIICYSGPGTNRCSHGGLPAVGAQSKQLFIQSAFFGPRAAGATAHSNQWTRNRYTWNGSYYYVLAK